MLVCIRDHRDWFYVSTKQVFQNGGGSLLCSYYNGSLQQALQTLYPEHTWPVWRFTTPSNVPKGKSKFSKAQYSLFQHLQYAFHDQRIELDYRFSEPVTRRTVELDVSSHSSVLHLLDIHAYPGSGI